MTIDLHAFTRTGSAPAANVLRLVALLASGSAIAACSGGSKGVRPYPAPTIATVLAKLAAQRATFTSFSAESVMDYWVGNDRVKGTVLVMGTPGAKVRFNAESPAGGTILADMACNGADFTLVDFQNNCALAGPCNADSIAQLLRVPMQPDDFFYLALGSTPVLDNGQNLDGTVTWDAATGTERVELRGAGGSQVLVIDARDGRWDIKKSERKDSSGKLIWSVENTDFAVVESGDDAKPVAYRMPNKTRFVSPAEKSDLIVDWRQRVVNPPLDDTRFAVGVPSGLATCGAT